MGVMQIREHDLEFLEPAGLPARHRRGRAGMTAYESNYRTLLDKPYHRAWHDTTGAPQAKAGFCTVAGVEKPHRATRSLYVRDSKGGTCWVAACDQHVPPMADDGEVS